MHSPSPQSVSEADTSIGIPPSPKRSRTTVWTVAALVTLGLAAAFAFSRRQAQSATGTAVTRDVPRMEGNAIVFSSAFRERAGIAFAPVEQNPFQPVVRVVGTVAFNPSYVAAIGTRLRGFVRRTLKYDGDRVTAGEALAEVESAELGEAQTSIAQVQARLDAAERNAQRESELLSKQLTTAREAEVAEAELAAQRAALQAARQRAQAYGGTTSRASLGIFVLRSPIQGHIVQANIAPGQSVDGNLIGYKVADLTHLWIELSVFERDLTFVQVGDVVDVSPIGAPSVKIPGSVAHVGEVVDPTTRSTSVRVTVDNPPYHLRPGQSVHASITTRAPAHDALSVPQEAVVYVDGRATVFVAETETRVHPVQIRLGGTDGSRHEVLEGLRANERIAVAGVFALKSELFR